MSPFLDSFYDPCPCGFPCEPFRRYTAFASRLGVRGPSGEIRPYARGPLDFTLFLDPPRASLRGATAADMLSELTYRSYAYNRGYGVTPEHWQRAFPLQDVEAMERRYQAEWATEDQRRHETIERIAAQPIPPFEVTR